MRALLLVWLIGLSIDGYSATSKSVQAIQGVVTYVADGDTIHVSDQRGAPLHVRIQGIDAPEVCQDHGQQSRAALSQLVMGRTVHLVAKAHDKYGRTIASVSVNGQDVARAMVAQGHAWSSRFHSAMGAYKNEELQARAARRGLWAANNAVEPRVFRKTHGNCEHPKRPRSRSH